MSHGGPGQEDPIDAFWKWWQGARGPLAQAIHDRTLSDWVEPISARVHAIDPRLAWELGPGVKSAHHICVSGEGDGVLRVTTQRWVSRAPPPDEVWEYYPSRQPSRGDPKVKLEIAGVALDYADFRFALELDDVRRRVQVAVYHPKLRELPDHERGLATFLVLDDALGEDGVERWVGGVQSTLDPGRADKSRRQLIEAVEALAARQAAKSFVLLEGKAKDGRRMLAVVNLGLKRLDHLLFDSHVEITIPYATERADGLYDAPVGEELKEMEDALLQALGKEAVYIGHETGLGRRVIHLHTAVVSPAQGIIEHWERMYPAWDIEVAARADPQWNILRRW